LDEETTMSAALTDNSAALHHAWVKHPCTCDGAGSCLACGIDASRCSVCHLDSVCTDTTHCPGEIVMTDFSGWALLRAVINHAGLDYVDGQWQYRPQLTIANARTGVETVWQTAGSIDRLVAYAERRLETIASRTARGRAFS
jgi:hypothetical protein